MLIDGDEWLRELQSQLITSIKLEEEILPMSGRIKLFFLPQKKLAVQHPAYKHRFKTL